MSDYNKYYPEIEKICKYYGFTKCESCPLYTSCSVLKKENETTPEYTKRWETGVAEAYKKLNNV